MLTNNLGYPRIGGDRELKKVSERYWANNVSRDDLINTGQQLRLQNWHLQKEEGIDFIPSNDFSFYDQVLDMTLSVGAVPDRYAGLKDGPLIDLYFAMARGIQTDGADVTAMEMTKWFDTNYHYIVPEFTKGQQFNLFSTKIVDEFLEAKNAGVLTKPVIIGPISFLLLGKEKEDGFHRIELLDSLLAVYLDIFRQLEAQGADWIQIDEPFLTLDLTDAEKAAFHKVYSRIGSEIPGIKLILTTYFEGLQSNTNLAASLPVAALHVDLVRDPGQLDALLSAIPDELILSLGLVDGRNIWKNDLLASLKLIKKAVESIGTDRIMIGPSCSLLHVPCDLDLETNEASLTPQIKNWLAFAKQKLGEIVTLKRYINPEQNAFTVEAVKEKYCRA